MDSITILCEVKAISKCQYTAIVVEDLNRDLLDDLKYVSLVILPNWSLTDYPNVGDKGYMQFESVVGGETQYVDKDTGDIGTYKYSQNYVINFIKTGDICKQDKFNFE